MIYVFNPVVLANQGNSSKRLTILAIDDQFHMYVRWSQEKVSFRPLELKDEFECERVNSKLFGAPASFQMKDVRGEATISMRTIVGAMTSSPVNEKLIGNVIYNNLHITDTAFDFKIDKNGNVISTPNIIELIFINEKGRDYNELRSKDQIRKMKIKEREARAKAIADRLESLKTPVGTIELWDDTTEKWGESYQWTRTVSWSEYEIWDKRIGSRVKIPKSEWESFLSSSWSFDQAANSEKNKGRFRSDGSLCISIKGYESYWNPFKENEYVVDVTNSRS